MDKIDESIKKSGNNLVFKCADILRSIGWEVTISSYYDDNITGKSREIDIIASKSYKAKSGWYDCEVGDIIVTLYIECKYLKNKTFFWFDSVNEKKLIQHINNSCKDFFSQTKQHHYSLEKDAAKMFDDNTKDNANQTVQKAIGQSLQALIFNRPSPSIKTSIQKNPIKSKSGIRYHSLTISYPIILFQDFSLAFKVIDYGVGAYENINSNFLLEVDYAYRDKLNEGQKEFFMIDVTSLKDLNSLIDQLEKMEVKELVKNIEESND